mgnify:CR=1 FL=1
MSKPSEFSLIDPAVQACPYPFYSAMRNEDPVYEMPETGFYIVSRYADCMEALGKPEIFSSKMGFRIMDEPDEAKRIYAEEGFGEFVDTLVTNDPPSHTRFRGLVNRAFTALRVSKMQPYLEQVISECFDQLKSKSDIEVVSALAIPVPMKIIADQLGVSRSDMDKFKSWSDAAVEPLGGMVTPERQIEIAGLMVEFQHYFAARIEERRVQPRDDMLNDLVYARIDGEQPLTVPEMLSVILQLLVAGNETTTNTIASGVLLLCRNPGILGQLREDPDRCINFAEEILRTESPVQGLFRMTTQATELGGKAIPSGAVVNLRYGSANRDEKVFECPEQIKLNRERPRNHLAFGYGIHTCIGSQLARREIEYTFREMARRVKSVKLSPSQKNVEYQPSLILRGLKELHVECEWL